MTLYTDIKKTMIEAWPESRVSNVVHMVAIDHKIKVPLDGQTWITIECMNDILKSVGMPQARYASALSTYIANHYPATSSALFAGRDKSECLKIMMREKALALSKNKSLFGEAMKEAKKEQAFVTIKARSLSKKHDWSTVK